MKVFLWLWKVLGVSEVQIRFKKLFISETSQHDALRLYYALNVRIAHNYIWFNWVWFIYFFLGVLDIIIFLNLSVTIMRVLYDLFWREFSSRDFTCLLFQLIIMLWQLPGRCSTCHVSRLLWNQNNHLYILHLQTIKSAGKVASQFTLIEYSKQANQQYTFTSGWSQLLFSSVDTNLPSDGLFIRLHERTWQSA